MRVRVRKSLRERHFALGCRRKNKESVLRRTVESDAESWFAGVEKQSLKPKRNREGTTEGKKNDDDGREKRVINFNSSSLSSSRLPLVSLQILFATWRNWYDKSSLYSEAEIFVGRERTTRPRDHPVIYSGRNYKKKEKKERKENEWRVRFSRDRRTAVIEDEIYERSAIAKTLIYIYEY